MSKPKVLLLDIETAPMELYGWGLHGEMHYGVNQIKKDWSILAWSAKWLDDSTIYYEDTSKQKNKRADKRILRPLHKLIKSADVIVSQNGIRFDLPKINARFIYHDMSPISPKPHVDTKRLAKKRFGFSSNSLEYLCIFLKVKYKKLTQRIFHGFDLWLQCLKGNKLAWAEMRRYNIRDVMALEDVYKKLRPWGINVNMSTFMKSDKPVCPVCTSKSLTKDGFAFKNRGKYQEYKCGGCGAPCRGTDNLLSTGKRKGQIIAI